MTVERAEEIIWNAYSDDTPPDALTGDEWRRIEKLSNAIDGNPLDRSIADDDAVFLNNCWSKVVKASSTL